MAVIHRAEITPTKLDLLRAWVPGHDWLGDADATGLEVIGAFRFDDPAGEVGIETHVVRCADGTIAQIPTTYRGAALDGADDALISTMQHSVLGRRWVYDGCADPVCVAAYVAAMVTGGGGAVSEFGGETRPTSAQVRGSGLPGADVAEITSVTTRTQGTSTIIDAGTTTLILLRIIGDVAEVSAPATLAGTWPGRDEPALLAQLQ